MMVALTALCFSCVAGQHDTFSSQSAAAIRMAGPIFAGPLLMIWLLFSYPGGFSLATFVANIHQFTDESVFGIVFLTLPSVLGITAYVRLRTTETLCIAVAIWLGTGWFLRYGVWI
jgi:hypothetical protein